MNNHHWAWRAKCMSCDYVNSFIHHDDDPFWASNSICADCGDDMTMVKCRQVYKKNPKFNIWNPLTWSGHYEWEIS
jgi:hypothetical protein